MISKENWKEMLAATKEGSMRKWLPVWLPGTTDRSLETLSPLLEIQKDTIGQAALCLNSVRPGLHAALKDGAKCQTKWHPLPQSLSVPSQHRYPPTCGETSFYSAAVVLGGLLAIGQPVPSENMQPTSHIHCLENSRMVSRDEEWA